MSSHRLLLHIKFKHYLNEDQAQRRTALIYNQQKHQKAAHGRRGTVLSISSQTKSGSSLQGVRLRNLCHLTKDMLPVFKSLKNWLGCLSLGFKTNGENVNMSTFTCTFKRSSLSVSSDSLHWETFSNLQQGQTRRRSTVRSATERSAKHRKAAHWCAECALGPAIELPKLFLLSLTLLPSAPSWERESWLK